MSSGLNKSKIDFISQLTSGKDKYNIYSLNKVSNLYGDISHLPKTLKILLENQLENLDGEDFKLSDVNAIVDWLSHKGKTKSEISFKPSRVLMQDFTGVPAIVDLAAMRDAVASLGGDPKNVNPVRPVDLVIDHSVSVDSYANKNAFTFNVNKEFERNEERYKFLKWGQESFDNFKVVPPGTGICHQVNLEYLAPVVTQKKSQDGSITVSSDTVFGTDSHTTMINGLGVLGWGVGGIEAEVSMLDEPSSMILPEVVGVKVSGALNEGVTATDVVLNIVNTLRKTGVVGKFVEFYGEGLDELSLADRATIANMAPEYGATCGFFPIDKETTDYLALTGRPKKLIQLVEDYAKKQGLWRDKKEVEPEFTQTIDVDLSKIETTISGPERPEDTVRLANVSQSFNQLLQQHGHTPHSKKGQGLEHGSVVVAAITSCTNTSNPAVMVAAGLVAKKAVERGMKVPDYVKTSLAPGSKVVTDYLEKTGLQQHLDQLGFNTVGYGCTSCIGNSGPLRADIQKEIDDKDLIVSSVSSGNRNFPGRVHGATKASYLASPPLIIAYALAGSVNIDLTSEPLGKDKNGADVYLRDLWPTSSEITNTVRATVNKSLFTSRYSDVFKGPEKWQKINTPTSLTYSWDKNSTYIKNPPYFEGIKQNLEPVSNISNARALAIFGNDITTDHISPAGAFKADTPAGKFLLDKNIPLEQFNSYGSRRGNHEIMMRGTYANPRIKNTMVNGKEGSLTIHVPSGSEMSIYDAAMKYKKEETPVVVFAGKNLGKGSSRDWAAKGPSLLGVKAVIAESYERIHRSNLVGMGIIPLQFPQGTSLDSLGLNGNETFDISGLDTLTAGGSAKLTVKKDNGQQSSYQLICRVDTKKEVEFIKHGGILNRTVRTIASKSSP